MISPLLLVGTALAVVVFTALRVRPIADFGLGIGGIRGLANFVSTLSGLRVGSAVPGRVISFFVVRIGRTGAELMEPAVGAGELGLSALDSTLASTLVSTLGSTLAEATCFACLCACIVSLRDGLDTALDKLRATLGFLSLLVVGKATSESSAGFGLAECFKRSS